MPKKSGLVTQREADIGRRVQRVREHINWPQPAFAAELDISRDRLASVEYARTPLRYPVGYRLCVVFDINPAWLADGVGDMKSTLVLPDLPMPEEFPAKSMFSRVYDQTTGAKNAKPIKEPSTRWRRKQQPDDDLIPNFDATAHVIRGLTDLLSKERFRSPLQRQEFALEITSYARDLALRLRRDTTRERAMAVSTRRGGLSSRPTDLAGIPARNAKSVLQLRAGIRRLDQEIGKVDAAMQALDPVAINPSRLPRPAALEVVQLEDAMDKIARQIDEAERKIKTLMSRRPSATG
jgi:transcriptional regulator with XRE-family HTH domain